jgi:hypothetical protein
MAFHDPKTQCGSKHNPQYRSASSEFGVLENPFSGVINDERMFISEMKTTNDGPLGKWRAWTRALDAA